MVVLCPTTLPGKPQATKSRRLKYHAPPLPTPPIKLLPTSLSFPVSPTPLYIPNILHPTNPLITPNAICGNQNHAPTNLPLPPSPSFLVYPTAYATLATHHAAPSPALSTGYLSPLISRPVTSDG